MIQHWAPWSSMDSESPSITPRMPKYDSNNQSHAHNVLARALADVVAGVCRCATCKQAYMSCPGHFGHIELAVPVYNPLVFS
jgi:hypothetical protein